MEFTTQMRQSIQRIDAEFRAQRTDGPHNSEYLDLLRAGSRDIIQDAIHRIVQMQPADLSEKLAVAFWNAYLAAPTPDQLRNVMLQGMMTADLLQNHQGMLFQIDISPPDVAEYRDSFALLTRICIPDADPTLIETTADIFIATCPDADTLRASIAMVKVAILQHSTVCSAPGH